MLLEELLKAELALLEKEVGELKEAKAEQGELMAPLLEAKAFQREVAQCCSGLKSGTNFEDVAYDEASGSFSLLVRLFGANSLPVEELPLENKLPNLVRRHKLRALPLRTIAPAAQS